MRKDKIQKIIKSNSYKLKTYFAYHLIPKPTIYIYIKREREREREGGRERERERERELK